MTATGETHLPTERHKRHERKRKKNLVTVLTYYEGYQYQYSNDFDVQFPSWT